ncbi:MAG TPA: EamA family transporter [Methylomirabilota bacterium]|nr:EamA family transporter [Methylomirabilota bacterium]
MTGAALALVGVAAVLHAGWNALAKRGLDQVVLLWCSAIVAAVALAPVAAWELTITGFPAAAIPFVLATIALHAVYYYTLGRSYGSGSFSLVYPVARGLGVALVPIMALVVFNERLSPLGTLGVVLVVTGVVALHLAPGALAAGGMPVARRLGAGTGWAVGTGLVIASYSLVDKAGVSLLHPVPYMMFLEAGCVVTLLPVIRARRDAVKRECQRHWREIVLIAVMSSIAYMLVLFAFRLSKTGYVVAAREMSIVISAVIGSLWLKEGRLAPRLAGASIVLAGVACVALAR